MAKQLETIDRFEIVARTSPELVGPTLAALTKLGLEDVGYRLITSELRYKGRSVHEVSATAFAEAFAKEHPQFTMKELKAHFKAAGRTAHGPHYAVQKMLAAKTIKKNGDGFATAQAAKVKRGQTAPYEVPNKDVIASAIRGRKKFTVREMRDVFVKAGRPEKSISPILSRMVGQKKIKSLGEGQYAVLAKGAQAAKAAMNGAGHG